MITALIDLFEAEGPSDLRGNYMYNDPVTIGSLTMPKCFITPELTEIGNDTNATDANEMRFLINAVHETTTDWNSSAEIGGHLATLEEWFEGRVTDKDSDDLYKLRPDSLAYILRKYDQIPGTDLHLDLQEPLRINYLVGIGQRGEGVLSPEARTTIVIRHNQISPRNL